MKNALVLAASLAAICAAPAFADDGRVSQASLAAMGLGGMETLSDRQGQEIRGQGAVAFSVSGSRLPGTFNFSPAFASGPSAAAAASGASSTASASLLVISGPPLAGLFVNLSVTVGSAGYAAAASN